MAVRELAREYTEAAVRRLGKLIDDPDGRIAVAACNALLDRGWGRPEQPVEHDGEVNMIIRIGGGE